MPVLPTVPFLILTTIFFNLGSEKFKNWFTETKLYKNQVEKYIEHKSMSIKSELLLLSSVSIFLILILLIFGFKIKILQIIIPILLFAKYTYFIISINPISSTKFKKLSGGEK